MLKAGDIVVHINRKVGIGKLINCDTSGYGKLWAVRWHNTNTWSWHSTREFKKLESTKMFIKYVIRELKCSK